MFVDNAGADVVLGMLPFARELLRMGAEVRSSMQQAGALGAQHQHRSGTPPAGGSGGEFIACYQRHYRRGAAKRELRPSYSAAQFDVHGHDLRNLPCICRLLPRLQRRAPSSEQRVMQQLQRRLPMGAASRQFQV